MEITINKLELAAELAHNRTLYESGDICSNEDEMYEINDGVESYTEEIQDRFNGWYDYYLGEIEKYVIN
jgi:hypothetical protein